MDNHLSNESTLLLDFKEGRYLEELITHYRSLGLKGRCADYIPALEKSNLTALGFYIMNSNGWELKSGDWEVPFTLQSISKVISFIAACLDRGISYVLERVDVEPTGDAFNSIVRLEMHKTGKPYNPMINAGAITVASLLNGETPEEKLESIFRLIEKMIGKRPTINETVFHSEWQTAYRNRSLSYYLKATGFLETEVEEALEVYLKQCSIEVNTKDIAKIGLILANNGYDPICKKRVFPVQVAKITKALMLTCGMYNASGKFAAFIGIPAKSGVSGGIMAAVPAKDRKELPFQNGCGIGLYGPAIDEFGNSLAGVELLKHLAQMWDLSIF
ncbi:glutaminase [Alkalihalobacillus sp. BA299]|uniref:glutaminase n=1 Tax=Alkalihalobacillus sp. BA299 TaxID=2815938 RepID=UPI001AD98264|nr:glutaminase [Alkalihalobacillus sp. BA299]